MSAAAHPQIDPSHLTPEYLAEYHGEPVVVGGICFIVINTVFVTLRFVSRYYQPSGWGWDDPLMLVSWLLNIAFIILAIVQVQVYGAGHHAEWYALHPELLSGFGYIGLYIQPMVYCAAVVAPRIAILILYIKIFTKKWMRTVCYLIMALMTAQAVADIFAVAFMCTPRAKAWNPSLEGHCVAIEELYIWGTFPNFVFDLFILILPISVVWQLQAPTRVKAGVFATFAIGSLGIITSIIRWSTYFTNRFIGSDAPWSANPLEFWMMSEITAYLMCACLLTFRTLLNKIFDMSAVKSVHNAFRRTRVYGHLFTRKPGRDTGIVGKSTTMSSSVRTFPSDFKLSITGSGIDGDELERGDVMGMGHRDEHCILVTREFSVA